MNVASPANSYVVVQRLKDHLREVLKGAEYEYREIEQRKNGKMKKN